MEAKMPRISLPFGVKGVHAFVQAVEVNAHTREHYIKLWGDRVEKAMARLEKGVRAGRKK
jgi:hypothetical protein